MLHSEASDQCLHCLPFIQQFLDKSTGSKMDVQILGQVDRYCGFQIHVLRVKVNMIYIIVEKWGKKLLINPGPTEPGYALPFQTV